MPSRVPVVTSDVAKTVAARMMTRPTDYSSRLLTTVAFDPSRVHERAEGSLAFSWFAKSGALNGFNSVHGGALSTLADIFTKIHVGAAVPEKPVRTVSFEISFLSAVFENKECACVTRLANCTETLAFTDFSFENETTGEVYARGTHVVSVSSG